MDHLGYKHLKGCQMELEMGSFVFGAICGIAVAGLLWFLSGSLD